MPAAGRASGARRGGPAGRRGRPSRSAGGRPRARIRGSRAPAASSRRRCSAPGSATRPNGGALRGRTARAWAGRRRRETRPPPANRGRPGRRPPARRNAADRRSWAGRRGGPSPDCSYPQRPVVRVVGRALSVLLVAAVLVVALDARLAAGGEERPRAHATSAGLRVLRSNPRWFVDSAGHAVYLTVSHVWWNLLGEKTWAAVCVPVGKQPFSYDDYLRRLQHYHHNFFRLWTLELTTWKECDGSRVSVAPQPWLRTGPGIAHDGLPRFDLSRPNPAYYARLRSRIVQARKRGMYVSVMLFEGWQVQFAKYPWNAQGHPFQRDNNINGIDGDANHDGSLTEVHTLRDKRVLAVQDAYVRRVVDAVRGQTNVLFEVVNESGRYSTAWQFRMIRFVHRLEAGRRVRHPVGMTFQNPGGDNATLFRSPADWVSPAGGASFLADPPEAHPGQVSLSDTDHHCGLCGDVHFPWKSLTRGHNPILMDPMDADPQREAIRRGLGDARRYAQRMQLRLARPQGALSSTGYCLAVPGRQYLVYQPHRGALTLDLRGASGRLRVEWFEPASGKRRQAWTQGGVVQTFRPPFRGPSVLFVRRI